MLTNLRRGRSFLTAIGLALFSLYGSVQPAEAQDIKLGMSAAFSGPSKGLGIEL